MKFYRALHPRPVVIIGSGDIEKGTINFMACAWITPLSEEPPLLGFACSKENYTHGLIKKFNQFSVNVVEDCELIFKLGSTSGAEIDKIKAFSLRVKGGKILKVPLLEEALATLECKVIKEVEVGDHTFFVGEVKHWEATNFEEYGYKEFWRIPLHKGGRAFCYPSKKLYFVKK